MWFVSLYLNTFVTKFTRILFGNSFQSVVRFWCRLRLLVYDVQPEFAMKLFYFQWVNISSGNSSELSSPICMSESLKISYKSNVTTF